MAQARTSSNTLTVKSNTLTVNRCPTWTSWPLGNRYSKESRFMRDLAKLRVWDDPAIRGALSWYLDVAENRRPAKFRIAATVATQLDLTASSEGALWAEL